jgi:pilus assembly protein CpaC
MARKSLFLAAIAALGFVAASHALAAESQMRVTTSDATARFMVLGVSKSVVIDFPTDIQDVLVGDKGIVDAVVRTKRRVYIIATALGQTNIFFYDADGRQIDALNIAVVSTSPPAEWENSQSPANVVVVFRGMKGDNLSCTPILCIDANKPGADQAPGTQNINVTGSTTSVSVGK